MSERMMDAVLCDWISARETRLSARRTLSGFSCEYAERGSGEPDDPGVPRCYLASVDEVDWCGGCRQRNRLFPGLKPLRANERRAFRRLCRVASRFKRAHDQRPCDPARFTPVSEGKACGSADDSSSPAKARSARGK